MVRAETMFFQDGENELCLAFDVIIDRVRMFCREREFEPGVRIS